MTAFLQLPIVLGLVQFVAGFFLKRWPNFPNAFIPIATFVLGIFGYTLAPKEANAAATLADSIGGSGVFVMALVQNLMLTGIHSTWKNTVLRLLGFLRKP